MSGKHYKGQEVSCCIKYFIFGFNIIFWVSACVCSAAALFLMHQCFFLSVSVSVMYGYFPPPIQFLCLKREKPVYTVQDRHN